MSTLEEFFAGSQKYVKVFDTFASKHHLAGRTQADHICYKCGSRESFEKMRAMFESESEYIYQSIISNRRIAVIRLKRGIETSLGTIYFIELSDQKPDNSQKDGFDHIEVYAVKRSYDDMVKELEASEKVIKNERLHHTTHDIRLDHGFVFRCTQGPLIEKIKSSEMSEKDIPEFGIRRENEERRDGGCGVIFDPAAQKYAVNKHEDSELLILVSGGVPDGEDIQEGVLREVTEESGLHDFLYVEKIAEAMTHYYNFPKKVNRVGKATCFLIVLKTADRVPTHLEVHEKFTLKWVTAEEIFDNWNAHNETHDHDYWIYFLKKAVKRAKELGYDRTSVI